VSDFLDKVKQLYEAARQEGPVRFAGAGHRKLPEQAVKEIQYLSSILSKAGFILNTGGAEGADEAFMKAMATYGGKTNVFIPWEGYRKLKAINRNVRIFADIPQKAYEVAAKYHPAWEKLGPKIRKLMARNVQLLMGKDLESKATFAVVWGEVKGGQVKGGTGHTVRTAVGEGIPVFNLATHNPRTFHKEFLEFLTQFGPATNPYTPAGKVSFAMTQRPMKQYYAIERLSIFCWVMPVTVQVFSTTSSASW